MNNESVARALTEQLALDTPPVALAFCDAAPLDWPRSMADAMIQP